MERRREYVKTSPPTSFSAVPPPYGRCLVYATAQSGRSAAKRSQVLMSIWRFFK